VESASRVLEIGPGLTPFPKATEFVDWSISPVLQGRKVHVLDINMDRLPFADHEFDFIYCRHTLEDIYNPLLVCQEMQRVAKAGYIETPSPIAECCRGTDAGAPQWRGYHHHRYLVYDHDGVLTFIPKFPLLEFLQFGQYEQSMYDLLNMGPFHWNTYCFWTDRLLTKMLHHGRDFQVQMNYLAVCMDALNQTLASHHRLLERFGWRASATDTTNSTKSASRSESAVTIATSQGSA